MSEVKQFDRKASIVVSNGKLGIDLSQLHFIFNINAMDSESPNNAVLRVYNLSQDTINKIKGQFNRLSITAGYTGNTGRIFDGTIKQIRTGRENNISRYVDFFAADSDLEYNFGIVNQTLSAGSNPIQRLVALSEAYGFQSTPIIPPDVVDGSVNINARGKVLFGMGRTLARDEARNLNATWSIQGRQLQVIAMQSYLPNEVVTLTSETGMVGVPEQTDQGISVKCLLNPRIRVGGLVKIDNTSINQFQTGVQGLDPAFSKTGTFGVPYNQWSGIQFGASVANDGLYRVYVIEYQGDNRGQAWYCELTCLAVNPSNKKTPVLAKN